MRPDRRGSAGFTIIEVLVALAVLSASLAAIGALIATARKGVRTLEQRVGLQQAARVITTGLPARGELVPGELDGEIGGYGWRLSVLPFFTDLAGEKSRNEGSKNEGSKNPWVPRTVAITVRSPSGAMLRIDTVRLLRRPGG